MIEFRCERQIDRGAGRNASLHERPHTESDAIKRQRFSLPYSHFEMLLTHDARIHHLETSHGKGRLRITRAERVQGADLSDQLQIHFVQTQLGIDMKRRNYCPLPRPPGHHIAETFPKLVKTGLAHGHTGCTRMTPKRFHDVPTDSQSLVEVEPTDRP